MKKITTTAFLMICLLAINTVSFAQSNKDTRVVIADSTQLLSYPIEVMAIIDGKCYGCHKPDAKNDKSRDALQWIQLQQMDAEELVGMMDEVVEVLEEGSMPPGKMLERYPHMKLTEDETTKLKEWAEETLASLMDE